MSQDLPILIVNEADEPIGSATKDEAQAEGSWHRIVYMMVEDPQGRVLLQLRGPDVTTFPNCWDVSAAGHVDEHEDYEQAAVRELSEETGIAGYKLSELGSYQSRDTFQGRKLNRFNRAYKVVIPTDTTLRPQASEVTDLKWFSVEDIKALIQEHPDQVANGLVAVFERYY